MPTSHTLLAAALALAASGCLATHGMGEDCTRSEQCVADGVCLKGVCSGYECNSDGDCDGDMICGSFSGVKVCTFTCEGDGDCPGEQACTEVDLTTAADSSTDWFCM
jgi:hypothetical protein